MSALCFIPMNMGTETCKLGKQFLCSTIGTKMHSPFDDFKALVDDFIRASW